MVRFYTELFQTGTFESSFFSKWMFGGLRLLYGFRVTVRHEVVVVKVSPGESIMSIGVGRSLWVQTCDFVCKCVFTKSLSPDLLRVDSSAGHCWSSIVASFSCPNCAVAGSSPRSTSSSEDITHTAERRYTHPLTHTKQ